MMDSIAIMETTTVCLIMGVVRSGCMSVMVFVGLQTRDGARIFDSKSRKARGV